MGEWPQRPSSDQGDDPASRQINRQAEAFLSMTLCDWGRRRQKLTRNMYSSRRSQAETCKSRDKQSKKGKGYEVIHI